MIDFATSQFYLKLGILASFYEVQRCSASNVTYCNHLTLLARLVKNGKIQDLKFQLLICVGTDCTSTLNISSIPPNDLKLGILASFS